MSVPIVDTDAGIYFVGDTKRFRTYDSAGVIGATKDGSLWTALTAVTLYLVKPNGTVLTGIAGTQESAGIWYADTTAGTFDVAGEWHRYWKLVEGSIVGTWGRMVFTVREVA